MQGTGGYIGAPKGYFERLAKVHQGTQHLAG